MRRREHWSRIIASLDPETDHERIYQILTGHEFPWDYQQSLGLALYRTYAVPSIGRLLAETGEFTERTQKRYDDTVLVLDAIGDGFATPRGKAGLRRMNQMHAMHDISNDDLRYVLSTFVVVPIRWLDEFGWRPLTEPERVASANYYRSLGRHMGIKDIPHTWREFADLMDSYEREHFAYDDGGRAVSDATLDLMATFPPLHRLPRAIVRRTSLALLDDPLLDAFGYRRPAPWLRTAAKAGLKARGRALRLAPPRLAPLTVADLPQIRSYPHGYAVEQLGTFPAGR